MAKNKNSKMSIRPWVTVVAVGGVIIIWCLSWFLICKLFPAPSNSSPSSSYWTERGTFGDMFGAVNSLFSGLAFAGVIIAILLQRRELELQREELELTRGEFKKQTEEFEKQNANLTVQRFENTFFSMLDMLNEIVKTVEYKKRAYAKAAFSDHKRDMAVDKTYGDPPIKFIKLPNIQKVEIARRSIRGWHLEQYFRVIYTILKFVEESRLVYKDKKRYSNILRAQLSNDELFFLGYNCLIDEGFIPFKLLLEKYSFLKHLPQEEKDYLIQQEGCNNTSFYHSRAFDKNAKFSKEYLDEVDNKFKELGIENFINYEEIHDIDLE